MSNRYLGFLRGPSSHRRTVLQRRMRRMRANAQLRRLDARAGPGGEWAFIDGSRWEYRESYLVSLNDLYIGKSLLYQGEFEFDKFERALRLLGRTTLGTLVDVGANVGTTCIPAVARGLADRAIALEPEPTNFTLLAANVLLNNLGSHIECHRVAAAAVNANATLEVDGIDCNFGAHSIAPNHGPAYESREQIVVAGCRLDVHASGLDPATDLLWMDVEGYEFEALKGATDAVGRGVPLVMEFSPFLYRLHGSLRENLPILEPYAAFWDLASDGRGQARPLAELVELERELGDTGSTDVLIVA